MRRIFIPICLSVAAACTSPERSGYTDIPAEGWVYGHSLEFTPEPGDSAFLESGSIALAVRHTNGYEYSNLWLEMSYTAADSVHTDTINLTLADVYGNWQGTGLGVSYQYIDTVATGISLDVTSPIKIRHIMRVDTLREIEQIGIFFIPEKK